MSRTNDFLDRTFNAVLMHEIRKLNVHLPKERRTLSELLEADNPTVQAVDGSCILLKTSELHELAQALPREIHDRLKLPLVVVRRMDLGKSVFTIGGDRIEEFVIKRILGLTEEAHYYSYRQNEQAYLYRPQVSELLRRFHSLVVIGFGIPKELADYAPSRD